MKRSALLLMGLLLIILSACTPMIYGVPQPTWERMSEPERIVAMDTYKQRQIARQRAAVVRAQQQRIYMAEQRRQQAAADAAAEAAAYGRLHYSIDAIYRGEGNYGDLLLITIKNGQADFRGQIRPYTPISFQIANGEAKSITIVTTKHRSVVLDVFYDGDILYLDGNINSRNRRMAHLQYDKRWSRGLIYSDVYTNNRARLQGVDVSVEIVGNRHRHDYRNRYQSSGSTNIIINEQPSQRVIIRERPQQIIIKERPAKSIGSNSDNDYSNKQRQRHEQLKKERRTIEKQRRTLEREQAEFKAEQQALENERTALAKKRARIKQLKIDAARDKRQTSREKRTDIREREKTVEAMEEELQEQSKKIEQNEKKVQQKKQKVKQQEQKIKQEQQKIEKEEEKLKKDEKDK